MSKIAELLKLAEKKKEDTNMELPYPAVSKSEDSVTRSKQGELRVSKSNNNSVEVSITKGNYGQASVSKSNDDKVEASEINTSLSNSFIKSVETSPSRDYTKVSNSIMKRAIPEKYFRGLSKHTYDVLYQRTRGAIVPTRTIQLTKDELVRLTGISKDAIKLHIKYLKETGLLKSRPAIGSHAGWEYEILVPEEIEETEQVWVREDKARQGKASENLPLHSGQNLPPLTHTNLIENKDTYDFPKTSLKTNTKNDDETRVNEAFSAMTTRLDTAVKRLTGKGVSKNEVKKWEMLADLLILELEVAASRTDGISSIPAFLTEVLRRKLLSGNSRASGKSPKAKSDIVGKPNAAGEYEKKPLDKEGREAALLELRDFANDDFLSDFKKWYSEEDWAWLTKELDKGEPVENETKVSE